MILDKQYIAHPSAAEFRLYISQPSEVTERPRSPESHSHCDGLSLHSNKSVLLTGSWDSMTRTKTRSRASRTRTRTCPRTRTWKLVLEDNTTTISSTHSSLAVKYCHDIKIGLSSVLRPANTGYMGDGFYRSEDPTNKVLKEQIHRQIKHTISRLEHKTQQVP